MTGGPGRVRPGKVLIVGPGDAGCKIARLLAASGRLHDLVLAGLSQGRGALEAGMIASCSDCRVRFIELDARDQSALERLLKAERPDLLVQTASLLSPWFCMGRSDPFAQALAGAGLGPQLPAQLPVLMAVMRAVRAVDFQGPVANLSFPDISHAILARLGLAPTVGLGNVSIQHLRVRAALRAQAFEEGEGDRPPPPIRLIGHHAQVYGAVQAQAPSNADQSIRVFLGENAERADHLAYRGYPIKPGPSYNDVTAAAALPVLLALLPEAAPTRFSAPAPQGLPGGYPVRFEKGTVALDLPPDQDLDEVVAWFWRLAALDGIAGLADDGTVRFTEAAQAALAPYDPGLAEPLHPDDAGPRFERLWQRLSA